jgi:hypothetical protein
MPASQKSHEDRLGENSPATSCNGFSHSPNIVIFEIDLATISRSPSPHAPSADRFRICRESANRKCSPRPERLPNRLRRTEENETGAEALQAKEK